MGSARPRHGYGCGAAGVRGGVSKRASDESIRTLKALKMPVLITSSNAQWQNGDTLPEIKEIFSDLKESAHNIRSKTALEICSISAF
jgi:hypothetical protein